ncbi:MAG: hypothetical protein VKJ46_06545 [Leptolyngbyaceae bacterium]|nr:hypothetical protein [Leptolyngbyaceae bacterium]
MIVVPPETAIPVPDMSSGAKVPEFASRPRVRVEFAPADSDYPLEMKYLTDGQPALGMALTVPKLDELILKSLAVAEVA